MKATLWAIFLLGIAAITTAAQLDRQSRINPELAVYVPAPFRGFAQEHITFDAVRRSKGPESLRQARKLVTRRPLPAEHLRLLALAEGLNGKPDRSVLAIQEAGQRGWRDPAVQETMLRLALANNDRGEAVRRYTALIANPQTPEELLRELGPLALSTQQARADFAAILAPAERWHRLFLRRGVTTLPPENADEVIYQAIGRNADFPCSELRQAERVIQQNNPSERSHTSNLIAQKC